MNNVLSHILYFTPSNDLDTYTDLLPYLFLGCIKLKRKLFSLPVVIQNIVMKTEGNRV